jgi:hypothetical protein
MQFSFSEEQRTFQASMRTFLEHECTPHHVRALVGERDGPLLRALGAARGWAFSACSFPSATAGSAWTRSTSCLLLEEAGRAALPEPVLDTAAVGVPLLAGPRGLERTPTAGSAASPPARRSSRSVTTPNEFVADAHVADLLLMQHGTSCTPCRGPAPTSSTSRATTLRAGSSVCVVAGQRHARRARRDAGRRLIAAALDRGALGRRGASSSASASSSSTSPSATRRSASSSAGRSARSRR